MNALVTYGSKRGGTEGIATVIADALRAKGHNVDLVAAGETDDVGNHDVVIIGGALYAMRWHRDARRFVKRNRGELQPKPVWFFSSGPLDNSAETSDIAPTRQVQRLMEQVNARGHVTFGGRLSADAKGWIAQKLAKTHSGDFRNTAAIESWAEKICAEMESLPAATNQLRAHEPAESHASK
jgi:menaquinone-dependent protoporphyrinogen oxidase